MDCIPYIENLRLEVQTLKDYKTKFCSDEETVDKMIAEKEQLIEKCKENLSKLSDDQICYRIYLHMLNGLSATKAIEKVSEENMISGTTPTDITTIWKDYYKKLKKVIKPQ